jgi:hypothetical protein
MEQTTLQLTTSPDSAAPATRVAPGASRCQARNRDGSRCRLHGDPVTGRCHRHALAQGINAFIAKLVAVTIQNRISTRRAAVLAYMANLLLGTLPTIDLELELEEMQRNFRDQLVQAAIAKSAPPDPHEPPKTYYDRRT